MKRVLLAEASQRPVCDYVLPGLLRGTVGMIVGQGAIGKSFLALQIAIGVALGRAIGRSSNSEIFDAPSRGGTACVFGEDPPEILQDRLYGVRQSLSPDDIAEVDRCSEFNSAVGDDLRIVQKGVHGELLPGPFASKLREIAAGKRLVILDPLVLLIAGCNENDNGDMSYFMRTLASIAAQTGTAILLLHHVGKSRDAGEDWELSRGASALTTNARLQIHLRLPSPKECAEFGISDSERGYWVRVNEAKANYASENRPPRWARRTANGLLQAREPELAQVDPMFTRSRRRNADPA